MMPDAADDYPQLRSSTEDLIRMDSRTFSDSGKKFPSLSLPHFDGGEMECPSFMELMFQKIRTLLILTKLLICTLHYKARKLYRSLHHNIV